METLAFSLTFGFIHLYYSLKDISTNGITDISVQTVTIYDVLQG